MGNNVRKGLPLQVIHHIHHDLLGHAGLVLPGVIEPKGRPHIVHRDGLLGAKQGKQAEKEQENRHHQHDDNREDGMDPVERNVQENLDGKTHHD